jgi:hypothetical protein
MGGGTSISGGLKIVDGLPRGGGASISGGFEIGNNLDISGAIGI